MTYENQTNKTYFKNTIKCHKSNKDAVGSENKRGCMDKKAVYWGWHGTFHLRKPTEGFVFGHVAKENN